MSHNRIRRQTRMMMMHGRGRRTNVSGLRLRMYLRLLDSRLLEVVGGEEGGGRLGNRVEAEGFKEDVIVGTEDISKWIYE